MVVLVDSSVIIVAERGQITLEDAFGDRDDVKLAISTVTASELLHGVHRASTGLRKKRRAAFVEHVLSRWTMLPFDLEAARIHARIWADLLAAGTVLSAHDLMIAATAPSVDGVVATRDKRSFPRVSSLQVWVV